MWSWTLPGEEDQRAEEDVRSEHHGQQLRVRLLPPLSQACAKASLVEEETMVACLFLTCCTAGDAADREVKRCLLAAAALVPLKIPLFCGFPCGLEKERFTGPAWLGQGFSRVTPKPPGVLVSTTAAVCC